VDSELDLTIEIHAALDAVLPPAPWLGAAVRQRLRKDDRGRRAGVGTPSNRHPIHVRMEWVLPVVAVLLAVAIVAAMVASRASLWRPVPGTHSNAGVSTGPPLPITSPFADCPAATVCGYAIPRFTSPMIGWVVAATEPASAQDSYGRFNFYRTDDGGHSWRAVFGFTNGGAQVTNPFTGPQFDLHVSADGKELLLITGSGSLGFGLFHSTDGGAHWQSLGLPLAAAINVYFLNTSEGWVESEDQKSGGVFDLFHTTDSGATWAVSGRVSGASDLSLLNGELIFTSSSSGWIVPGTSMISLDRPIDTLYRTVDGGATWKVVNIPAAVSASVPLLITQLRFFDEAHGVAVLRASVLDSSGRASQYVSSTSDGGLNWSALVPMPIGLSPGGGLQGFNPSDQQVQAGLIDLIDSNHWIFSNFNPLFRTSDGGSTWETLVPVAPGVSYADLKFELLEFTDPSHGVGELACARTPFLTTSDGGDHWVPLDVPGTGGGYQGAQAGYLGTCTPTSSAPFGVAN